jgi:hypothetical protein
VRSLRRAQLSGEPAPARTARLNRRSG